MMEVAVSILVIITLGAYIFYLKNIANKDTYSKYSQTKTVINKAKAKEVKPELASVKAAETKSQYKCVVIKTGSKACQAVQLLALKPILMGDAPVLPLTMCDVAKCTCKFTKHDDRRTDDRRAHLKAAREIMGDALNRREKKERRKTQFH
jgi:hypothetical protein